MPSQPAVETSCCVHENAEIQNIIVPIDFSKMSVQAIQIARQLARRFGASIHLAHVRHLNYAADFVTPAPPVVPFAFMTYEQNAEQTALKELKKVASECGVASATCDVLSGAPPFDEICRLAQSIPADLVVMPTHGRTGLKHVFLGSTAERIVQHSSCPVLVTRGKAVKSTNGSQAGTKQFLSRSTFPVAHGKVFATRLRSRMNSGPRSFCCTPRISDTSIRAKALPFTIFPACKRLPGKLPSAKCAISCVRWTSAPSNLKRRFTDGSPVIDICAFAKDHDVDLIITSTHGFTGFTHVLIGSIAEQVVRHAPCSVLVVPSHPHVRAANLAKSAGAKVNRVEATQSPNVPRGKAVTRKDRKLATHAFPERRKTNKFRESHSSQ